MNVEPYCLAEVFCHHEKRNVTNDLTLKYDRKYIRLEVNDLTSNLDGTYINVYETRDGRMISPT